MIRNLKGENEKLKNMFSALMADPSQINVEKLQQMQEDLNSNALLMTHVAGQENQEQQKQVVAKVTQENRQLVNLNEDVMLNYKIKFDLTLGEITVGSEGTVRIGGQGVGSEHAMLRVSEDSVAIKALEVLYINGISCTQETVLSHNDRLVFGKSSTLMFKAKGEELDTSKTWESCQKEVGSNNLDNLGELTDQSEIEQALSLLTSQLGRRS